MRPCFKRFLILSLLSLFLFCAVPAGAYNVTVSPAASSAGAFVGNVWTPNGDSNLSFGDLNTRLIAGNVDIITNGAGNITVAATFINTHTESRLLTLSAQGAIFIQGIQSPNAALSVTANASAQVGISAAGAGLNGGSFTSSGTDFSCLHSGMTTTGGDVHLNHTGIVTITDAGLRTGGGSLTSSGTDFANNSSPLQTEGGDVHLNHTGNIVIAGGGLISLGGSFTSSGVNFSITSSPLTTAPASGDPRGDVLLNHTGTVTIGGGGLISGRGFTSSGTDFLCSSSITATGDVRLSHSGNVAINAGGILITENGSFISSGADFSISGTGVRSSGGDVTLNHSGNVNITNGGVLTSGGNFRINRSATAAFTDTGARTDGGDILVQSNGMIHINAGNPCTSGGGEVSLRSATNITIDGFINTTPGTGGELILQGDTAAIVRNIEPYYSLGSGDITLYVGALETPSVPTLSEWGMLLMSLVLLGTAVSWMRRGSFFNRTA